MVRARVRAIVRLVLLNVGVFVLALALVEGLASVVLVVQWIRHLAPVAERAHTKYDPELGWVNAPNTVVRNMYGAGVDVRINDQGLREDVDVPANVPPGTKRLVCLGDSFTFGFGVAHDQTWCHQLALKLPALQTVNMGLGGYGLDQDYLWYKRDQGMFKHDITVVAVVTDDFDRMHWSSFIGYPKPKLEVDGGTLQVKNVPVPHSAYVFPWRTLPYRMPLHDLAVVRLYRSFFPEGDDPESSVDPKAFHQVLEKLAEDLQRITSEQGRRLVFVYLPSPPDFESSGYTQWYLGDLQSVSSELNIPFIELVSDFRSLPKPTLLSQFITPGSVPFVGADGHYNANGNRAVAELLYRKMMAIPELAAALKD